MQDYRELVVKICDIIRPFNKDGIDLNEETDLAGDLGLDSLKVMELLVTVEDSLDISIPLNVLPRVRTIKDFAEQLQLLLSERS
ncbi:MAG: acyl carrier protein [Thermodesulfobacteriota bacterium]|jgi:acyl carrier protein|nr:MAG: acyl carrier protein [Thermodesulfobacteriota bacterium]